ncbi:hypothetical protein HRR99_03275 [Agrobacterium vaccinii]|uniref:hypothetical protein n=1 Tax=Agrobacterium vaccinii TaxID=2735528 RepID=UPI001E5F5896|nr:hypothetical protein [Agrobacterium vaccinii]UHS60607.1 hypothetical protein HRR99_03275 [Agrobacterium vaccinii]
MPLLAISRDAEPKPSAILWPMKTDTHEDVQIVIGRSVLLTLDRTEGATLTTFKRYRLLLEKIASNKYDRDGADQIGNLQIYAEDLSDPDLNK